MLELEVSEILLFVDVESFLALSPLCIRGDGPGENRISLGGLQVLLLASPKQIPCVDFQVRSCRVFGLCAFVNITFSAATVAVFT